MTLWILFFIYFFNCDLIFFNNFWLLIDLWCLYSAIRRHYNLSFLWKIDLILFKNNGRLFLRCLSIIIWCHLLLWFNRRWPFRLISWLLLFLYCHLLSRLRYSSLYIICFNSLLVTFYPAFYLLWLWNGLVLSRWWHREWWGLNWSRLWRWLWRRWLLWYFLCISGGGFYWLDYIFINFNSLHFIATSIILCHILRILLFTLNFKLLFVL